MTDLKKGYADTSYGQIHYLHAGSGEAVIMLHRTPLSACDFELVLPFLADKYHAIAMETLGYGNSDSPPRQLEMADYVHCLAQFMDSLSIRKAYLVGEHTGAGIAGEFAILYPERINKLIVSGYPLFTAKELETRRRGIVPSFLERIEPLKLQPDGSHMTIAWEHALDGLEMDGKPLQDVQAVAMAILQSGTRNVEAHLALWQYRPEDRLPLIKCPTLVLMTVEDQFYDSTEAIHRMIPGSKVKIVKGGGSYFSRHSPQRFAEEVTKYIESAH